MRPDRTNQISLGVVEEMVGNLSLGENPFAVWRVRAGQTAKGGKGF